MTGAAVEGFARAVALDLDGRYRVNVVSPGWVAESRVASGLDPLPGIWARDLAVYYRRLVEGDESGAVHVAEEALS
jgi:NAD(P)-dependent dehydrogenase (short-subunit alcohol dehydrogenase family)